MFWCQHSFLVHYKLVVHWCYLNPTLAIPVGTLPQFNITVTVMDLMGIKEIEMMSFHIRSKGVKGTGDLGCIFVIHLEL